MTADTLTGHSLWIFSASLSPDGSRIVTGSADKTAKIWEADTGRLLVSLEGHSLFVRVAVFSPDGSLVATGSDDKTLRLWETTTGKLLTVLEGHRGAVTAAAFSPDGSRLLTGSEDHSVRVWDLHLESRSSQEIARIIARQSPWQLVHNQLLIVPKDTLGGSLKE